MNIVIENRLSADLTYMNIKCAAEFKFNLI